MFSETYRGQSELKRVVYKYDCKDCNGCYIGEIARDVDMRKVEHMKALKGTDYSRIAEHFLKYGHENNWETNIIATESNGIKRNIKKCINGSYQ